jgi:hypothetical protein
MWKLALVLNVFHLAYHQVTSNFDFYPFNNIRPYTKFQRIAEVTTAGFLMGFPVVALSLHSHKMIGISCGLLGFLLLGEFMSWWRHYLFGPTKVWKDFYDKTHGHTIKFLPPIKDHPIPNMEHCILHVITLATFVVTLWYYLSW